MSSQLTDTVVMVSPDYFGFNEETAGTNIFQNRPEDVGLSQNTLTKDAVKEFNGMVKLLKNEGIRVLVLPSREDVITPDAVFPNNWMSSHENNTIVLYPMFAPNRRAERQTASLINLLKGVKIQNPSIVDFTHDEQKGNFLEGTGSLVLDRENHVAFAMQSPRTTKVEFDSFCKKLGYKGVFFHAYDKENLPIYHTNVLMSIGDTFAVVCMEAIKSKRERNMLEKTITSLHKELIPISLDQMYKFCGNILQLESKNMIKKIVMSKNAYNAFTAKQKKQLTIYGKLVPVDIGTIEKISGGSARCMLAEVFS
jgi:hypothetical protein